MGSFQFLEGREGSTEKRLVLSFFSQTPGSDSCGTLWEDRRDKGGDVPLGKSHESSSQHPALSENELDSLMCVHSGCAMALGTQRVQRLCGLLLAWLTAYSPFIYA